MVEYIQHQILSVLTKHRLKSISSISTKSRRKIVNKMLKVPLGIEIICSRSLRFFISPRQQSTRQKSNIVRCSFFCDNSYRSRSIPDKSLTVFEIFSLNKEQHLTILFLQSLIQLRALILFF